jgi:hypothetical protein
MSFDEIISDYENEVTVFFGGFDIRNVDDNPVPSIEYTYGHL